MNVDYYQSIITQKSWQLLTTLHKHYHFTLIGGWAVYLYTMALKSKDIDVIVDYGELAKLQKRFVVTKNDRLQKYEIKQVDVDVDIYVPFYSNPGLPIEVIHQHEETQQGFRIPKKEVLLILKQNVYEKRKFSAKGQKDRLDVLALVTLSDFDFALYQKILEANKRKDLKSQLIDILSPTTSVPELNLNSHQFAKHKQRITSTLLSTI